MKETDLRVQRTRQRLRQALIELVTEHGYEAVTVLDIVERAQVGHKTFYRHYPDKEALLYALLGEILAEAQLVLQPPSAPLASEENTLNALYFAQKYAKLWLVLLRSPVAEHVLQPLIAFGLAEGTRFFGGQGTPDQLVAYHFATSMRSLIQWWLENDMPYPPEEMAEYINRLLIRPIRQLS